MELAVAQLRGRTMREGMASLDEKLQEAQAEESKLREDLFGRFNDNLRLAVINTGRHYVVLRWRSIKGTVEPDSVETFEHSQVSIGYVIYSRG